MYAVADVMTQHLVTLNEGDDLALADSVLHLGRIRHLPVVDAQKKLLGLVTHRDLLRIYADRGEGMARSIRAGEVMNRELTTATPEMPLKKALTLMLKHKFGCLPVIDSSGTLVGIVTEADMSKFALHVVQELERFQNAALATTGL